MAATLTRCSCCVCATVTALRPPLPLPPTSLLCASCLSALSSSALDTEMCSDRASGSSRCVRLLSVLCAALLALSVQPAAARSNGILSSCDLTPQVWPKAGTIVIENSTSIGGEAPEVIRATVTFNGTSKVAVTITGPGVSASCTLDLASQNPSCN